MKLIFCSKCNDIFSLRKEDRACICGASSGQYIDNLNAVVRGAAIPLGFLNSEFVDAVKYQPESGQGYEFTAFVIPKEVSTITHEGLQNRRAYERIMLEIGKDNATLTELSSLMLRSSFVLVTYMDRDSLRELKITRLVGYQDAPDSFSAWSSPSGYSQSFRGSDTLADVITSLNDYIAQTNGYLVRLHY